MSDKMLAKRVIRQPRMGWFLSWQCQRGPLATRLTKKLAPKRTVKEKSLRQRELLGWRPWGGDRMACLRNSWDLRVAEYWEEFIGCFWRSGPRSWSALYTRSLACFPPMSLDEKSWEAHRRRGDYGLWNDKTDSSEETGSTKATDKGSISRKLFPVPSH